MSGRPTRKRRWLIGGGLRILCLLASVAILSGQTFRSGTDLLLIDVTVLDGSHRPIMDLVAEDFTVFIDGQRRPVSLLEKHGISRSPVGTPASWMKSDSPDVFSNKDTDGQVVIIVIDDGSFAQADAGLTSSAVAGLSTVQMSRKAAKSAVNALGANDVAAVVYTEHGPKTLEFTGDRTRLLAAIDQQPLFPGPSASPLKGMPQDLMASDPLGILRGSCLCGLCSLELLDSVTQALGDIPRERKTVLYISAGVPIAPLGAARPEMNQPYQNAALSCNLRRHDALGRVLRGAQLANVTIQAIDPKGIAVGDMSPVSADMLLSGASTLRIAFLRTIAETTGGRVIVNDNDVDRQMPSLIAQTRTYFLLGVAASSDPGDGRPHDVRVNVNRPGVEVRTRRTVYLPTSERGRSLESRLNGSLEAALGAGLSSKDVPLEVSVAPYKTPGDHANAELAIVLGITRPLGSAEPPRTYPERVEVLSAAFDSRTGAPAGERRHVLELTLTPTGAGVAQFELLSRLPVTPGSYEVRLGVKTADGKIGTVHADVSVPDYSREALALSGLVLTATPARKAAPLDAFRDFLPFVPTTRRSFVAADHVNAFVRAYRGTNELANSQPQARIRLIDSSDKVAAEGNESLAFDNWQERGFADYSIQLPLAELPPGEYLLAIDITAGPRSSGRAIRFQIER